VLLLINLSIKIGLPAETSCASSIAQRAAIKALAESKAWIVKLQTTFQERRDLLWEGLTGFDALGPIKPEGTFYMFCDITKTGFSAMEKLTGWHSSIIAQLSARGQLSRGAVPVELTLQGEAFDQEIEKRGWELRKSTTP